MVKICANNQQVKINREAQPCVCASQNNSGGREYSAKPFRGTAVFFSVVRAARLKNYCFRAVNIAQLLKRDGHGFIHALCIFVEFESSL